MMLARCSLQMNPAHGCITHPAKLSVAHLQCLAYYGLIIFRAHVHTHVLYGAALESSPLHMVWVGPRVGG